MSRFDDVLPAAGTVISYTRRGLADPYQMPIRGETGTTNVERIYVVFRVGEKHLVRARCRINNAVDCCGAVVVSSVECEMSTQHHHDDFSHCTYAMLTVCDEEGYKRLPWDSDAFRAIPDAADEIGDIDPYDYGLYSLGCAISLYCRDTERNCMQGFDRIDMEDGTGTLGQLFEIMNEITMVNTTLYAGDMAFEPEEQRRCSYKRGGYDSYPMDSRLEKAVFHNYNSGNDVCNYTFVGVCGDLDSCEDASCELEKYRVYWSRHHTDLIQFGFWYCG